MSQWAPALRKHLEELVRLNEKLLRLIEGRCDAMASRDAVRLEALLARERQVGLAIFHQEQKRREVMARLEAELGAGGASAASATLSEVAEWLGEPHRGALLALRAKLHATSQEIARQNQTSLMLAQRFLPYFEELLSVLLEGTPGGRSYTAEGQAAQTGRVGMNVLDVRG